MKGIIWFRSDLRTDDNPALLNAINNCEEIIAIYIFSELQWKLHNESNIKHEFLINNLNLLDKSLKKLNIPLIAINTKSFETLPEDLCSFAVKQNIDHIFWNNEFGFNECKRDLAVIESSKKIDIKISRYSDQVIYEPGFLRTGQGNPFSVFTPFKRRWVENFDMNFLDIPRLPNSKKPASIQGDLKSTIRG